MKNVFSSLKKHFREINDMILRKGVYMEGNSIVIGGMDIGFTGKVEARLLESLEVAKAIREGDTEKELFFRIKGWEQRASQMLVPRVEIANTAGANTFFAEGITQILNVALGYSTQQQYHYFLVGANDVTPVEGWTLGTSGTKIRTAFGEVTAYVSATRPTWTFAAAASKSITNNASPATIVASGSSTARGACLVSKNVKDGTSDNTGYAIAGKRFSSDMPLALDSELRIVHTLSGSVS